MTKIVQLSVVQDSENVYPHIIALCEDGSLHRAIVKEENLFVWFPLAQRTAEPGDYEPTQKGQA